MWLAAGNAIQLGNKARSHIVVRREDPSFETEARVDHTAARFIFE
jgi:hypothetical protein